MLLDLPRKEGTVGGARLLGPFDAMDESELKESVSPAVRIISKVRVSLARAGEGSGLFH